MGLLYALIVSLLGMVLGTDNQEKEPSLPPLPCEGSPSTPWKRLEPPTTPELPSAPSLYPTCSHIQKHPLHKSQLKYVA